MKLRRPLTALSALAFAFSALVTPIASASTNPTHELRTLAAEVGYGCGLETEQTWVGRRPHTASNEQALVATIDPSPNLGACTTFLYKTFVSAWIALVPGNGNSYDWNDNAILQVGVVNIHDWDNSDRTFFFIAAAGCNGTLPQPIIMEGPNVPDVYDSGPHKWRIDASSSAFSIWMDDKLTYNEQSDLYLLNRVSCWTDETKDVMYSGEKLNAYSRYSGTGSTDFTVFSDMKRKYGNVWYNLGGTSCENTGSAVGRTDSCYASGQTMKIWTN